MISSKEQFEDLQFDEERVHSVIKGIEESKILSVTEKETILKA